MQTLMSKGVTGDKAALWTLQVQASPLHNLASLDSLVSMVKIKSRREALMVIGKRR